MSYGVLPTGFSLKPLEIILAEIEAANIVTLPSGVVQTSQSPLGQINGLMANSIAQVLELILDAYQSYDPDQAEGIRLEMLGRMRLLVRGSGETDEEFRQAITNTGRARIDMQDLARAVRGLTGVSYAQVFVNDGEVIDANGMSPHTVAVAALGGDNDTVTRMIRDYVVPGIGTYGNVRVDTNIEGFCRSIWLTRPVEIPVWMTITVSVENDRNGCPPPSPAALVTALVQDLSGPNRPVNGTDIDEHMIRVPLAIRYPNVRVISVSAGRAEDTIAPSPLAIAFTEIVAFATDRTTITVI